MSIRTAILGSFLATLIVWTFIAWPLPRYMHGGIPSSAANIEQNSTRRMIMGDHLQLLYYYWLSADTMTGNTPLFYNPYEFNTGSDDDRKYVGFDNAFFAGVFTAGYLVGGRAVGWNLMGFVSLWLTYLFTWLLLRSYSSNRLLPPIAAAIAIALPYRWHMLFGGSPSGLAMAWVPMLLWGIDALIRRNSAWGSLLAGLAVFLTYWNDAYVLFFSMMLGPCWAILVLLHHGEFPWKSGSNWKRVLTAAIPLLLLLVLIVVMAKMKHSTVAAVESEAGRDSWNDVLICSPRPFGLWAWRALGHHGLVYLGYIAPLVILAGLVSHALLLLRCRAKQWRETAFFALLCAGIIGVVIMALGAHGPLDARIFTKVRSLLPPYELVRQPAKIFTILPSLLALAALLSLKGCLEAFSNAKRVLLPCAAALGLLATVEYRLQVRPTICLLDSEQPAYAAVAEDAEQRDVESRALVLPIWPGNSAWASLYEHYVSLYRIRMLNGYLPSVPHDYIENVYRQLDSCTSGSISDAQIEKLKSMGVDYVILHENAFPEKVSAFPVGFAIKRLLNHPWLELLKQHDSVWAFRIRATAETRPPVLTDWNRGFPVSHAIRECEWHAATEDAVRNDPTACRERFVQLTASSAATLELPIYLSRVEKPVVLLRAWGPGVLNAEIVIGDDAHARTIELSSESWKWTELQLPVPASDSEALVRLTCSSGDAGLDMFLTAAGDPLFLEPGESLELPAPLFFHAGYTDLKHNAVVLRTETEADNELFYGPYLPLRPGRYALQFNVRSSAPAQSALGSVLVTCGEVVQGPFPVAAGLPHRAEITIPEKNPPLRIAFKYARTADMSIDSVALERLE